MIDFRTGQEIYKMSLEHCIVSETKKVLLKTKQNKNYTHTMMGYVKGIQEPIEKLPNGYRCNNLSNKINQVVLKYNLKCKINTSINETLNK